MLSSTIKSQKSVKQKLVTAQNTIKQKFAKAYSDRKTKEREVGENLKPVTRKIDELIDTNKKNEASSYNSSRPKTTSYSSDSNVYDSVGSYSDDDDDDDGDSRSGSAGATEEWTSSEDDAPLYENMDTEEPTYSNVGGVNVPMGTQKRRRDSATTNDDVKAKRSLFSPGERTKLTPKKLIKKQSANVNRSFDRKSLLHTVVPGTHQITESEFESDIDAPGPSSSRVVIRRVPVKRKTDSDEPQPSSVRKKTSTPPLKKAEKSTGPKQVQRRQSRLHTVQPGTREITESEDTDNEAGKRRSRTERLPPARRSKSIKRPVKTKGVRVWVKKNGRFSIKRARKVRFDDKNKPIESTSANKPVKIKLSKDRDLLASLRREHGNVFRSDDEIEYVSSDDEALKTPAVSKRRNLNKASTPRKRLRNTPHAYVNLNSDTDDEKDGNDPMPLPFRRSARVASRDEYRGEGIEADFIPYKRAASVIYEYFDDPNELCDRLRLLISSKFAGNTNHTQEINSIVQELRELGLVA